MVTSIKETFDSVRFGPAALRRARSKIIDYSKTSKSQNSVFFHGNIRIGAREYRFDGLDHDEAEFFDYLSKDSDGYYNCRWKFRDPARALKELILNITFFPGAHETTVEVEANDLALTQEIFDTLESEKEKYTIQRPAREQKPRIFIGHGRNNIWRDLKDHLSDQHHYKIEAYETGARAGHTIRDIIGDMSESSDIAFLVLTAEDELTTGDFQARPNVIHETGLFQGTLGFARAIVLLEEGCQEFSNLFGIQQIRFSKGNIKETFGDVLATIQREFGD
ncbi:TIR domain-containing protein [Solirhodobacter olei]|uniref:TIR domain-containing protein n=1 Tax=Solirhodobacter olei TaxID=2493082 RepID=UPI000FDCCE88|nr:nucleotide-binding protein [Solirhodobacter olei]